jgi:glutaredoxin-like protein NrdH
MPREVVVYSTPLCAPCERLKAYLRAKGVAFTVRDVMVDEEAAMFLESRNIRSTPVLAIDDEIIVGFDPERIARALQAG